jgi:Uma2 family endonuclease
MSTTATAAEVVSEPEVTEAEPEFPPHIMTIDRYERLVESGVYGAKDPVFLWKGRLVEKMPKGWPHSFTSMSLFKILMHFMPEGWHAVLEVPLRLSGNSMPEPDLMIVRGSLRDYLHRSRTALDVAIVIEVADSSLAQDSVSKLRAYAFDSVPIYWIVNIPKGRIVVYCQPTGPSEKPSYQEYREYGPNDEIPVLLDGLEVGRIAAKEILP